MHALVLGAHLDDSDRAGPHWRCKIVNAGGRVDVVCFGNSDEDFADVADRETASQRISPRRARPTRFWASAASRV